MSDFVLQQHTICNFSNEESWVILSPIEQSIKQKIESVGTPLKDWDIKIYRGVLTGYNDAFIISTEKRDEILANCQTEDERLRTAELIRPILRGRDIKRYGYDWANLWLIATFPSRHYDIEMYPAVKAHLLSFGKERLEQTGKKYRINGEEVKARKKTSNKWFETQDSISYWEDFFKPKIVYQELTQGSAFALDLENNYFISNTGYLITGSNLNYLIKLLNSRIIEFTYRRFYATLLGDNGLRWLSQHIMNLPIPVYRETDIQRQIINSSDRKIVEMYICQLYNFSTSEISYFDSLT